MSFLEKIGGALGGGLGIGNMVEEGVEGVLTSIGVDAKTAEMFGDYAALGVNLYTGNTMAILMEAPDLLENFEQNGQQGANMHEGGSVCDMLDSLLNGPAQRDHRRRPGEAGRGNNDYAVSGNEYYRGGQQLTGTWRDLFAPSGAVPPLGSDDPQAWMQYASEATGEELKNLVLSGQVPPEVMKDPAFALAMQESIQASARMVDLVKSMLTAEHDVASKVISNFRV